MTLDLNSNFAAGLTAIAAARGLSVEEYLRGIVHHELSAANSEKIPADGGSGMVLEKRPIDLRRGHGAACHGN